MTRFKHYVVMGDPIALCRHRYGGGKFYDSQKNAKLVWGIGLKNQHNDEALFAGPLCLDVLLYFSIPKTYVPKKKINTLNQWHIFKPDVDNVLKWICDVATGILFKDDCIISKLSVEKVYDDGNGPRSEFAISELKEKREQRSLI